MPKKTTKQKNHLKSKEEKAHNDGDNDIEKTLR